ncbi:AlpA family phage regulatory protein [uncultured Marinobacter sp.]|uniref:helix-turn-helix transcriptional regulator n=1 Tax=uncultured Marinobacter sp. TaxID=187379 RepID=UPI0030D9BE9B
MGHLGQVVIVAETTIYDIERRGEFPPRFNLTPRCVVWDLEEVEAWIEKRKRRFRSGKAASTPGPDVRQRIARPVRSGNN